MRRLVLGSILVVVFMVIAPAHVPTLVVPPSGGGTITWPQNATINYKLHSSVPGGFVAAVDASFHAIDVETPLTFVNGGATAIATVGTDGTNVITFANNTTNLQAVGGALAVTLVSFSSGTISEADIVFNPATTFSTNLAASTFDVQSVGTHEAGHFVGLDHSPMLDATMYPTTSAATSIRRTLAADDRSGLRLLYPGNTAATVGTVTGTIQRAPGQLVGGAHLVLRDVVTGRSIDGGVSRGTGAFTISAVPPSDYHLYVEPLDTPFQPANLGSSYWGTVTFDTSFRTAVLGGTANPTVLAVRPGVTTNVGTFTVAGPAPTLNLVAVAALATANGGFSFSTGQPVGLSAPYSQWLVVVGNSVNTLADSAFNFQSPFISFSGPSTGSGTLGGGLAFKIFPVAVASNAPSGGYLLRVVDPNTSEMAIAPGLVEVLPTATPQAWAATYGPNCPGAAGATLLTIPSPPSLGNGQFRFALSNTSAVETAFFFFSTNADYVLVLPSCNASVDLSRLIIPFPGFSLPCGAGSTTLFMPLPNTPALAGLDVYAQCAVIVNATAATRVTNAAQLHFE